MSVGGEMCILEIYKGLTSYGMHSTWAKREFVASVDTIKMSDHLILSKSSAS